MKMLNYHVQGHNARAAALAGMAAVGALALTACDPGPKCLDYSTQVVSTTTIVNGKVVPGTSIVTVCTRYEDEGKRK